MIDEKDILYLDNIYKRKDDCENDMNKSVDQIHKLDTDITELKTYLRSIKWLIMTAIGCIITIIIQNLLGG